MVRLNVSTAILTAALAASTATAFTSSFVTGGGRVAFAAVPSSSTALQMNLFDRMTRVAKATANDVLKKLEDPEKIMNQALEDMQVRFVVVFF